MPGRRYDPDTGRYRLDRRGVRHAAINFECTREHPWQPGLGSPVRHHGAGEIDRVDHLDDDGMPVTTIVMRCPNCGTTWERIQRQ